MTHELDDENDIIRFAPTPSVREVAFDCVVDRAGDGWLIGIEVLDFHRRLGSLTVPATAPGVTGRWSYDAEHDAFWVQVAGADQSASQVDVVATGLIDGGDRLVAIRVPRWSPATQE